MKTQENKPITTAQIKKIYTLLNQKGLLEYKPTLVYGASGGTTQSTKELTSNSAKILISLLMCDADEIRRYAKRAKFEHEEKQAEDYEKCIVVFRAIYRLAWDMDIIYGETTDDYHMNVAKLNMFCRERGTVKKNITDMELYELRKTQRQFEAMYSKHKNKSKIEA